jgi:methylmalonyl-CoA decarboxylase
MGIMGVNIAKEMFFSAQPLSAERAEKLGILNHMVPADELESFTYKMAHNIANNSPLSISVIKEQIRLLANAHPLSPHTFERVQGLRRLVYDSSDYAEGINAFLEKRPPSFQGK